MKKKKKVHGDIAQIVDLAQAWHKGCVWWVKDHGKK